MRVPYQKITATVLLVALGSSCSFFRGNNPKPRSYEPGGITLASSSPTPVPPPCTISPLRPKARDGEAELTPGEQEQWNAKLRPYWADISLLNEREINLMTTLLKTMAMEEIPERKSSPALPAPTPGPASTPVATIAPPPASGTDQEILPPSPTPVPLPATPTASPKFSVEIQIPRYIKANSLITKIQSERESLEEKLRIDQVSLSFEFVDKRMETLEQTCSKLTVDQTDNALGFVKRTVDGELGKAKEILPPKIKEQETKLVELRQGKVPEMEEATKILQIPDWRRRIEKASATPSPTPLARRS